MVTKIPLVLAQLPFKIFLNGSGLCNMKLALPFQHVQRWNSRPALNTVQFSEKSKAISFKLIRPKLDDWKQWKHARICFSYDQLSCIWWVANGVDTLLWKMCPLALIAIFHFTFFMLHEHTLWIFKSMTLMKFTQGGWIVFLKTRK